MSGQTRLRIAMLHPQMSIGGAERLTLNAALGLAYRGRLDASTPGNGEPLTGADLRGALDALVAGDPVPEEQIPSMGCSIKWR